MDGVEGKGREGWEREELVIPWHRIGLWRMAFGGCIVRFYPRGWVWSSRLERAGSWSPTFSLFQFFNQTIPMKLRFCDRCNQEICIALSLLAWLGRSRSCAKLPSRFRLQCVHRWIYVPRFVSVKSIT